MLSAPMYSPPPDDTGLALGAAIGPFRLEQFLGEGAMARVFLARRADTGQEVALKLLKPKLAADPVYLRRFVHEARAAGEVRHPNLVPILEAGEVDGRPYLAAAFIGGRSLASMIEERGPLPFTDVVRIARQAGAGLDALHAAGLIHRDIKPANILLSPDGTAAVTDFGLAKGPAYTVLTNPGQVMGTLDYLAPELIRGGKGTDRSDLYAFGCVIHECLTGKPPFGDRPMFQLAQAILNEPPPDATIGRPDLPQQLHWAVGQALEKDPNHRPPSCAVFAQMIANCATPFAG
ncbi:MAG TPA: serine/threonine-protein kinase [Actinomycetota bacterium]|nr:serine/threonine-protein kinase [Actinomycetota bacterium]